MIAPLAVLTVVTLAATQTDTTLNVKAGTRLEINNFSGEIAVETWAKNAVRVEARHSSRAELNIEEQGPTLSIEVQHWRGIPTTVDYHLTVPKWMSVNLSGVNTEISVSGTQGEVEAQTVQGDVSVTGGTGKIAAESVEGSVRVIGAKGRVECSSVNAGVEIRKVSGPIAASSVNGEILLEEVDSDDVEASTINGEVLYSGLIKDRGSYRFSSHGGSVLVAVPERANATVSVSTFSGDFSSTFPIPLTETRRGKGFHFTIGSGSARIELESFQGEIKLHRPGEAVSRSGSDFHYEYHYDKGKGKGEGAGKSKNKNSEDPSDLDHQP